MKMMTQASKDSDGFQCDQQRGRRGKKIDKRAEMMMGVPEIENSLLLGATGKSETQRESRVKPVETSLSPIDEDISELGKAKPALGCFLGVLGVTSPAIHRYHPA